MTKQTHVMAGLAVAALLAFPKGPTGAEFVAAVAGATSPDLDHPGRGDPIRWLASRAMGGHRGFLHSLPAALLLSWAAIIGAFLATGSLPAWPFFFAAGYFVHLALDILTPTGIPLLFPFVRDRIALLRLRTGGRADALIGLAFLIVAGAAWPALAEVLKGVGSIFAALFTSLLRSLF